MGKLQSKHACKRRESPEGDSFVVNAFLQRGMEDCGRYSTPDHKLKNIQGQQCSGEFSGCMLESVQPSLYGGEAQLDKTHMNS
ncbi:hypothetical protein UPYG_G00157280 [Umbra pygmaea]|uniref:Uncharacterized protein n=1 Tax=Umbra pygmaea TaxID=75934 RepID=A0ABD0XNA8_UMBPY